MTIGVLALQGDVREHRAAFDDIGQEARPVREIADLKDLAGLVLPGGESTTLSLLLQSSGLFEALNDRIEAGLPVFGTCAGLVLLAKRVNGGRADQVSFGALDCAVVRNGYGRQRDSFESWIEVPSLAKELGADDGPVPAVFIRAPLIESVGPGVEVLATLPDGSGSGSDSRGESGSHGKPAGPVVCRQKNVLATAFHPELTGDRRLHQLFVKMTKG